MSGVGEQEPIGGDEAAAAREPSRAGRLARSTAFFSFATGLSRIAGLVREIVAASYFGVRGPMSAFTIAFQLPNTVRSVFAIAPLFWNVAIIAVLAGLAPAFPERDQIYAYAIGILVGTVVQLAMLV